MEITSRDLKVNTFVDLRTIEEKKLKENVRYYLSTVNHFRERSPTQGHGNNPIQRPDQDQDTKTRTGS